jgi:hypothetical protein
MTRRSTSLIAGYMSKAAAQDDYEAVPACGGYLHGAVVVSKDLQGNLSVEQTDMQQAAAKDASNRRAPRVHRTDRGP